MRRYDDMDKPAYLEKTNNRRLERLARKKKERKDKYHSRGEERRRELSYE